MKEVSDTFKIQLNKEPKVAMGKGIGKEKAEMSSRKIY